MIFKLANRIKETILKNITKKSFYSNLNDLNDKGKTGLMKFFEDEKSYLIFDSEKKTVYGRAWKSCELRNKSFEDLHKLWYILLKERNLLSTQENEARRLNQIWFGKHREIKCKLSMARIKGVLSERLKIHLQSQELTNKRLNESADKICEGELFSSELTSTIKKHCEKKRKTRKFLNYQRKRQSLFI
jgi:large subunit ribosomal protein L47